MSHVRTLPGAIEEIVAGAGTWQQLEEVANEIAARVIAPSRMRVWVKRGIGPQGAFAQVIMEGPGALAEELGTRSRPPNAPLRRALRGGG